VQLQAITDILQVAAIQMRRMTDAMRPMAIHMRPTAIQMRSRFGVLRRTLQ
jgi:hypothetical protein